MDVLSASSLIWGLLSLITILVLTPAIIFFAPVLTFYFSKRGKDIYKKMESIPGPNPIPIFGNALSYLVSREKMIELLDEYSSKYFPFYKVWTFQMLVVNPLGPEYVKAILHSSKNIQKGQLYSLLRPWLGTGLLTSKGEKWFAHRKFLTPAFHFKILERFIPIFLERSEALLENLSAEATSGRPFDIVPYISQCTLEVICESAMGIKLDKNDAAQQEYVAAVYKLGELLYHRITRPWLLMDWLFALTPSGFAQRKYLNILHSFTVKVISEKKKEYLLKKQQKKLEIGEPKPQKKKVRAFLDLLVELSLEENLLNEKEIREEVDTFMFEGHDTTSMAICWILFSLASHPDIQEKAREEVDAVMERMNEMKNAESERSIANAFNEMQLLERCIKESLRIYPSVPFISRVIKEELSMGKHPIPVGAMVHIHIRNIHQNPYIYPEPRKFDPDRFLPEACQNRHPYAYIPFSAGPRNCIGQKFAMLEMKSIVSSILRRYRLKSVDKPEDVSQIADLVLRPANGINIVLEHRDKICSSMPDRH